MSQPSRGSAVSDRGPWREQAACRGVPLEAFFGDGAQHHLGLSYCRTCPVRRICLFEALAEEVDAGYAFGIRGGSAPERASLARGLGPVTIRRRLGAIREETRSSPSAPGRVA